MVFVLGGKLIQRTLSGSTDIVSAELGAPDGEQTIPQDSASSGEGHSLNTLNILVPGEKKCKKSLVSGHVPGGLRGRNSHSQ